MRAEKFDEKRKALLVAARAPARAPRWALPAIKAALLLTDALLAALCFAAAFYLREGLPLAVRSGETWEWNAAFAPYAVLLPFVIVARTTTLARYDLYRLRGEYSLLDDGARLFKAMATASLLIVAAAFLHRGGYQYRAFSYARGVFVLDFVLSLAVFGASRLLVRVGQRAARARGINLVPTLVVGCNHEATLCIDELRAHPEFGYRVIGAIATDARRDPEFNGVPIVGTLDDLAEAIKLTGANEVIITDTRLSGDKLFDVMMSVGRRRRVEFRIAPSLFNFLPRKTEIDQIGALPMIRLFREPLPQAARALKRTFDIALSAFILLLLAPLWLLIAILIKLDSRGPVLYKQERVGMDGRIFLFYKFRTMRADADDRIHREYQRKLISGQNDANLGDDARPIYKLHRDPRVTRVGRWLRRTSLDELPQLLNVLRGEMSIVGPRPPIPYEVEFYEAWHRKRLDMKPGITGLWQVSGRNRLTFDEMVRLDLFYIENWSLWLDLKIILRTLPAMLRGEGAY